MCYRLFALPRFFCRFSFVYSFAGPASPGWGMPSSGTGLFQHGHSSGDPAPFAGAGLEPVLHGYRVVVARRDSHRQCGYTHWHRLDPGIISGNLHHRRDDAALHEPQKSAKVRSRQPSCRWLNGSAVAKSALLCSGDLRMDVAFRAAIGTGDDIQSGLGGDVAD